MAELTEPYTIDQNGWLLKIHPARGEESRRLMVLIHGWTGDENVMTIFARKIPEDYWMVFPRGPVQAPEGGFGWLDRQDPAQDYDSYRAVARQLWERLTMWRQANQPGEAPIDLMGFSQGAAICYTLAAEYPSQIGKIAALAGYIPQGFQDHLSADHLAGKRFFVAHGARDDTVPVDRAREAVAVLESAGAQVTYCEDDVGHKLSAACFRGLGEFFA